MNTFHIGKPWINISKSELLFEKYIKAPNQYKYDIEFQNDDTINRNRLFFDFMLRTLNRLNGLYMDEIFIVIDTIKKYQCRKPSAAEFERPNREKNGRNKKKEGTSKPSPKNSIL